MSSLYFDNIQRLGCYSKYTKIPEEKEEDRDFSQIHTKNELLMILLSKSLALTWIRIMVLMAITTDHLVSFVTELIEDAENRIWRRGHL